MVALRVVRARDAFERMVLGVPYPPQPDEPASSDLGARCTQLETWAANAAHLRSPSGGVFSTRRAWIWRRWVSFVFHFSTVHVPV